MILFITYEFDQTSFAILRWLNNLNKRFHLLTFNDKIEINSINHHRLQFTNKTRQYTHTLTSKSPVLFRQGKIPFYYNTAVDSSIEYMPNYCEKEANQLRDYLHYFISTTPHLGHPATPDLNKLQVLHLAKQLQLCVPNYLYSNSYQEIKLFFETHKQVIIKTIQPNLSFQEGDTLSSAYTSFIKFEDILFENEKIYPSFFQALIPKQMDIRVFYLNRKFYSNAIFSQANKQTQVDYRHYDTKHPNRSVPFQLPIEIEKKVQQLIDRLSLTYCSIDFIYGIDNQFYFLEINPVGQFGNVSYTNNCYLEREMALTL
jgi:ATP-GRASP peptide maturase of grasp-with-spasm system